MEKQYSDLLEKALRKASHKKYNGIIDLTKDTDFRLVTEELEQLFPVELVHKALYEDEKKKFHLGKGVYVDSEKDKDNPDAKRYKKDGDKYIAIKKDDGDKQTKTGVNIFDKEPKQDKESEKERKAKEKLDKAIEDKKETAKEEIIGSLDQVAWENEDDKENFTAAITKIIDGEEVTEEELALINKYAAIKDSGTEAAIYMSNRTPGDFRQGARIKVNLKSSAGARGLMDRMAESGMQKADPVTTSESVPAKLKTKDATLGKVTKGRTKKHPIKTKRDKNGIATEVKVAGKTMRRQPMPSTDALIAEVLEYKKQGMSDRQAKHEAQKVQAGIKRYNRLIDTYANANPAEMETVDLVPGADVATKEGREQVAKEGPKKVADALREMIDDPTEAEKELLDRIEKLGDIEDADEYEKEAMKILARMSEIASIKKGAPDVAEALVLCTMNKKGVPTVAPAGETFKVADLIQLPEEDLDPNDPDYIKKVAAGGPVVVFMTTAGGLSVKKDGGAASGFRAKLDMTTFKLPETKDKLKTILDHHNHSIATTSKGEELSEDRINKAKKELDDVEKWARENNLVDDEDLKFPDGRTPNQWANDSVADWQKKGTLPPDCPTKNAKGECIDEENKRLLIEGLDQYARGGLLAQAIHNKDLDFQDYHNANANTKDGELELSDGIECLNDMAFSANPGFSMKKDKKGNFIMRPNAVYAGNLHKRCR